MTGKRSTNASSGSKASSAGKARSRAKTKAVAVRNPRNPKEPIHVRVPKNGRAAAMTEAQHAIETLERHHQIAYPGEQFSRTTTHVVTKSKSGRKQLKRARFSAR